MYRRMLVPLDGSELAEVVFPYAQELAGRLDIDIVLLHVYSSELSQFAPMRQAYITKAADIIRSQARAVQKRTGIQPGGKAVEVQGELAMGYHAEEIIRYADENAIDLILMAAHGRSGLKRWAIGSVAAKTLSASKIPVWLVRAGIPDETPYDKWPSQTLLVLLDGSELAESVLPHVEVLAKQRGAEPVDVVLLRVSETPTMPSYYGPELSGVSLNWGEYLQREEARRKKVAKEYLAQVEKRLKDSNISVQSKVLEGKAADEIIGYANKNPFNIIVMATHGRSGLSRLVYGSVAANLLQGVSNPIFLVKPK
jgi:nucleotide-binding universal stress UspA family protein